MKAVICLLMFFHMAIPFPAYAEPVNDIVIDPGHGGYDSGIRAGGLTEKDISLSTAKELEAVLKDRWKRVALTRKTNRYLSIEERASFARGLAAVVFISLHATESGNFVIYVTKYPDSNAPPRQHYALSSRQRDYLPMSKTLSARIGDAIKKEFGINVSLREMPLAVLNPIKGAAVLIESPITGLNDDGDRRIAEAIARGIQQYEGR
ncbi:MAG: N-acetylmuramoyl-L-alanine amidase [Thermodesulfovibrionales bacterium]|nr:N-acetylmuramoyl-L-alanine amidase [Thermodesulfovibrionales bacterium]